MTLLDTEVRIYWEDLELGTRFGTRKRTVTETDLVNFVNLTWLTEELFSNGEPADRAHMGITGRVVPGGLVYVFAEGLVAPSFQAAGIAFLNAELDIKADVRRRYPACGVRGRAAAHDVPARPRPGAHPQYRGEPARGAGLAYTPLRMMRTRQIP